MSLARTASKPFLPLAAALALAACSGAEEEPTYETDVVDQSGGELIVRDADEPTVEDLELPETPMTPVPPGATPEASPLPSPNASPSPRPEPSPVPAE